MIAQILMNFSTDKTGIVNFPISSVYQPLKVWIPHCGGALESQGKKLWPLL
jgi:hypothetical protein